MSQKKGKGTDQYTRLYAELYSNSYACMQKTKQTPPPKNHSTVITEGS